MWKNSVLGNLAVTNERCTTPSALCCGVMLVEILCVLALLGVLLLFGIPGFARLAADWRVTMAVNRFNGHLRWARQESMRRSTPVSVCSGNAAGCRNKTQAKDWTEGWIVFADDNGDGQLGEGEALLASESSPSGLSTITASTAQTLTFRANGLLTRGHISHFVFASALFKDGEPVSQRRLCINATGRVRVLRGANRC